MPVCVGGAAVNIWTQWGSCREREREPTAIYAGQDASIFELAVGDVEELIEEGFELL